MKNRTKALLLAAGLSMNLLAGTAFAAPLADAQATDQSAQADADAQTQDDSQSTAAAQTTSTTEIAGPSDGVYSQYYATIETALESTLSQLSSMTEDQLQDIMDYGDSDQAKIAFNWDGVREELGNYVGVEKAEVSEDGYTLTFKDTVKYDGVSDRTTTIVTYTYNVRSGDTTYDWEIDYPMSKLIGEAGLNTILGLCTVFIVLLFLSFVIGQIHWIPDLISKKANEKAAAQKAAEQSSAAERKAAAPAGAVATVADNNLMNDTELVAVITAAIAAYRAEEKPASNGSADGFVVRSIKKSNKKSWQNA